MNAQRFTASIAVAAACALGDAHAHDASKYPDWTGAWYRANEGRGGSWDLSRPPGRGQQPPLTPEYHAIWQAGLASTTSGGMGNSSTPKCIPAGLPRMMIVLEPMEIIITPETTYIHVSYFNELRRVYTDGRTEFPDPKAQSLRGYSIGRWEDADGDGRYDTLAIETRSFKGHRTFDGNITLHRDNKTVMKERITPDRANPDLMHNDVTVMDSALTQPWMVKRSYRRIKQKSWIEYVCEEGNRHVAIGKQNYVLSADGHLMPAQKDQPPPDLRNFIPRAQ